MFRLDIFEIKRVDASRGLLGIELYAFEDACVSQFSLIFGGALPVKRFPMHSNNATRLFKATQLKKKRHTA